jgi:hypothetical protein
LIEILKKSTEKLRVYSYFKFDATNLLNVRLIKGPVVHSNNPLLEKFESYFFINGYPAILEADNEEVIQNFLDIFKEDTGIEVDRSMAAALPDFDQLNPPRRRKKTKNVETLLVEEENDEVDAESGSERPADEGVEKEKRSKKMNERPLASSKL